MKTFKPSQNLLTCTIATLFCASANAQWVRWEISAGGNGHWYKAVAATNSLTWSKAAELALTECGHLATITSSAENDFVFGLVNSPAFFSSFNGSGPALGGFQPVGSPEPGGGWTWVTGEAWSFTNWHPDSPDGGVSEDRLHFFSGTGNTPAALWNDLPGDDTNLGGYVVEREDDRPCAEIFTAVEVCWNAETNKTYKVQWVESPLSTNWSDLGPAIQATNTTVSVFDSTRGRQRRFYRIELLP